jgi:hypothetical protein
MRITTPRIVAMPLATPVITPIPAHAEWIARSAARIENRNAPTWRTPTEHRVPQRTADGTTNRLEMSLETRISISQSGVSISMRLPVGRFGTGQSRRLAPRASFEITNSDSFKPAPHSSPRGCQRGKASGCTARIQGLYAQSATLSTAPPPFQKSEPREQAEAQSPCIDLNAPHRQLGWASISPS